MVGTADLFIATSFASGKTEKHQRLGENGICLSLGTEYGEGTRAVGRCSDVAHRPLASSGKFERRVENGRLWYPR